jgi:enoyl-CoA hydratase/carnithine racemase
MSDDILLDRDGAIATVTLHHPDKLNAMTNGMWQKLKTVFDTLSNDSSVRCIVLRGAGEKAFAAGADISSFERDRHDVESARHYGEMTHGTLSALIDCPHPMVALIHGVCVGGGLELATICDMRICGTSSRFGIPVKRLGLVVAYPEVEALLKVVSPPVALEIMLEGRVFDAAEAKDKGLVNRVVADNKVEEEVYATARRIAEGAPLVARWHKKFVRRLLEPTPLSAAELDESYACFGTKDFQIGYRAFLAKTKPDFTGS